MALRERERLPEEREGFERPDPWFRKPEPKPEPDPREEYDEEDERLRIEIAKLEDERNELQKRLRKKQRGRIKGINARSLYYQLAFNLELGITHVDILHDGSQFLTVEESDVNPLKELMDGILPKVGSDGSNTYKQTGTKEIQTTNKAEGSTVFDQKK